MDGSSCCIWLVFEANEMYGQNGFLFLWGNGLILCLILGSIFPLSFLISNSIHDEGHVLR